MQIKSEYQSEIDKFKSENTFAIKNYFINANGLPPILTILAVDNKATDEKERFHRIVSIVDISIMSDDEKRHEFAIKSIPMMLDRFQKEGKIPLCVSFACAATQYKLPKYLANRFQADRTPSEDEFRKFPKQEVITITYETATASEAQIYEIVNDGTKRIDRNGDLIDNIALIKGTHTENPRGLFANLFYKPVTQNMN